MFSARKLCMLACAWLVTVASISISITYLNYATLMGSGNTRLHMNGRSSDVRCARSSHTGPSEGGPPCTCLQDGESEGSSSTSPDLPPCSMKEGDIDIERSIPPLDELYRRLAIVTAISENHYLEALPWIASIQQFMPDKKVIVYNLGLNKTTLNKVKQLCNVEVRTFPFGRYPRHVLNLHTYAWKPIIIDITLREFGAIFWGDSSIRLRASIRNLLPVALKHHGYMTHFHGFDAKIDEEIKHQYFFTHPQLYPNLGVDRTQYYLSNESAPHAAANRQLYINGSVIQDRIVQPMLRCALEYRCIAPKGAKVPEHRFDASVLAILIYKNMRGEWTRSNNDNRAFDEVAYLRKTTKGKDKVKFCLP